MSCTFWNLRRRKAVAGQVENRDDAAKAKAVVENPVENVEKPTPRKKRGAAE